MAICCFVQSDADYWLLSDADFSITDMWRTDGILSFSLLAIKSQDLLFKTEKKIILNSDPVLTPSYYSFDLSNSAPPFSSPP
mgnify:CR=1 FL=1